MTRLRTPGRWALWITLLVLSACSSPGGWFPRSSCLVVPASTDDLPAALALRTRMHLTAGKQSVHLETVAQRVGERLMVVGLSNYGIRLFAVQQNGQELAIEGVDSGNLEILARWVMDALHRIYWIQPPADGSGSPLAKWDWAGETVIESRTPSGRRRQFVRGANASARVTIDYPDGVGSGVEIRNPPCGYDARVIVLEASPALRDFVAGAVAAD